MTYELVLTANLQISKPLLNDEMPIKKKMNDN